MIKVLRYAIELFWPPKPSECWEDQDGRIFTAFDPKQHVVGQADWSRWIGEALGVGSLGERVHGQTRAGKSSAFLDRMAYGQDSKLQLINVLDSLNRYVEVLEAWSAANRNSGNRTKHSIGTEQQHTANILRDIALGKPVIFLEEGDRV
jgi:hypothetical protein